MDSVRFYKGYHFFFRHLVLWFTVLLLIILFSSCSKDEASNSLNLKGVYVGVDFYIGCPKEKYFPDEISNFINRTKLEIGQSNNGIINTFVSNSRCFKEAVSQNASFNFFEQLSETTFLVDISDNSFESVDNIFTNGRYKVLFQNNQLKIFLNEASDHFILLNRQ